MHDDGRCYCRLSEISSNSLIPDWRSHFSGVLLLFLCPRHCLHRLKRQTLQPFVTSAKAGQNPQKALLTCCWIGRGCRRAIPGASAGPQHILQSHFVQFVVCGCRSNLHSVATPLCVGSLTCKISFSGGSSGSVGLRADLSRIWLHTLCAGNLAFVWAVVQP